jgi:hypothetical protein
LVDYKKPTDYSLTKNTQMSWLADLRLGLGLKKKKKKKKPQAQG